MGDALTLATTLVSLLVSLIAAELLNEVPGLCGRFLKKAEEKIPPEERGRYTDEWEAELDICLARRSRLRALLWAWRVYRHAAQTADALREVCVLDGEYDSDLELFGRTVVVSAGCKVQGTLICREVDVEGVVLGPIDAWRRVRLRAKSVVHGNICTKQFSLEEGAEFHGRVIEWNSHQDAD